MGYQFFDNADLNYRMQFTIGSASSGVVDVGEVLTVAEQVTGNDDQAWYEGFRALAERIESAATASAGVIPSCPHWEPSGSTTPTRHRNRPSYGCSP